MQADHLFLPDGVQRSLSTMVRQLAAQRIVERLWARDASLWHPSASTQARIAQRLGWLELPAQPLDPATGRWLSSLTTEQDLLFVASEAAQQSIRLWRDLGAQPTRRLRLLDSIAPQVAQETLALVDWRRTALVLAAADLTPEMAALADRALDARAAAGSSQPLALVTAPGSQLARRYRSDARIEPSAALLTVPPDIGERFGAGSAFGLLPAALAGQDLPALIAAAQGLRAACRQTGDLEQNPGALLGALLAVLAQHGRDKLTLVAPPALTPLAEWIAGFVAASLGKHGRGFVPVVGEPLAGPAAYRTDRSFVVLRQAEAADAALEQQIAALRAAGQPLVVLTLAGPESTLAHQLVWQVAVAVAASVIGVNPFDEPDTVAMRDYIQRRLLDLASSTLQPRESLSAAQVAQAALPQLQRVGWVALVSYLPPTAQLQAELSALRRLLLRRAGLASLLVFPLRDHAWSVQLLHAGRPDGLILALTSGRAQATPPDQPLARLAALRQTVELAAWRRMGRPALELALDDDPLPGLRALYAALDQRL